LGGPVGAGFRPPVTPFNTDGDCTGKLGFIRFEFRAADIPSWLSTRSIEVVVFSSERRQVLPDLSMGFHSAASEVRTLNVGESGLTAAASLRTKDRFG
jgi:hypothetical protein